MKPIKHKPQDTFDRFLTSLGEPITPVEQIEDSAERLLNILEVECAIPVPVRHENNSTSRISVRAIWTFAAVAAAVSILAVALHTMAPRLFQPVPVGSIAEAVDGARFFGDRNMDRAILRGDQIQPGQKIRTAGNSGAVVLLADGSHVELSAAAELAIDRTPDGLQVNLTKGSVIVTASKQLDGHLYVQTKECVVSVVGTVFAVSAEPGGSRVSVFQGEVHVKRGTTNDVLLPGQQIRTNPSMVEIPLEKEIEWSHDAADLVAMLAQLQPVIPSVNSDPKLTQGSITGTVVEAATNAPIPGVTVEWSASPCDNYSVFASSKSVSTGIDGRFEFQNLDFGPYCLLTVHPGGAFVPLHYLRRGWTGRGVTVSLTNSSSRESLQLEMEPTGSISGRVVDDAGEPAAYARVRAFERSFRNGERQFIMLDSVYTDDRGAYRLPWLPPGKYYVSAIAGDPRAASILVSHGLPARTEGFEVVSSPLIVRHNMEDGSAVEETNVPVWYGGTVDRKYALPVEVIPGRNSNSVDISLGPGKTRALHVRGTVVDGETGLPLPGAQIRLMPHEWVADPIVPTAISNAKGEFDVAGVAADSYLVYALGTVPQAKSLLSAFSEMNVGGNIDGFNVKVIPSFDIEGRVVVEGGPVVQREQTGSRGSAGVGLNFHVHRDPDLAGSPTALVGSNGAGNFQSAFVSSSPTTNVGPDGKFAIRNIGPGNYHIYMVPANTSDQGYTAYSFVPTLPNAYVKSFRIGNRDILNTSLSVSENPGEQMELVIGTDVGEIDGKVLSDDLAQVRNATVVLVPDLDRQRIDRYKVARTDTAGHFHLQGIAPGGYKIFAWSDVELGAWLDPEFIAGSEHDLRAKPVRMDGGAHKSIDLTIIQDR